MAGRYVIETSSASGANCTDADSLEARWLADARLSFYKRRDWREKLVI